MSKKSRTFSTQIVNWYHRHKRDLPWRNTNDPYLIWLSEVILQQTRVDQGLPYFEKFRAHFPDVEALAHASQDKVLKLWEGLGYYNRARNMHQAAKDIVNNYNSRFPKKYKKLTNLKGIGPYTGAAIASFAFDQPYAVVDGNVYRVLARYYGIDTPIDTNKGKKAFAGLAEKLLDKERPGLYNQAIMEFGALHCTPRSPKCASCPVQAHCTAYKNENPGDFPVKNKKQKRKKRYFNYLVIKTPENKYYLEQRGGNDIWRDLYQFPLIETKRLPGKKRIQTMEKWEHFFPNKDYKSIRRSKIFKQTLSHQKIQARFWEVALKTNDYQGPNHLVKAKKDELKNYAFPKIIVCYIDQKILPLRLR